MTRGATIPFNQPAVTPPNDDMIFIFNDITGISDGNVFTPFGQAPLSTGEPAGPSTSIGWLVPQPGTIHSLRVKGDTTATGTNENWVVHKNNTGTSLVAQTVIGNATALDSTNSVTVIPGDLITIQHNLSGNANFTGTLGSMAFTPS